MSVSVATASFSVSLCKKLEVPQAIAYHEEITNVSNEAQRWRLCLSKHFETNPIGGSALEITEESTRGLILSI